LDAASAAVSDNTVANATATNNTAASAVTNNTQFTTNNTQGSSYGTSVSNNTPSTTYSPNPTTQEVAATTTSNSTVNPVVNLAVNPVVNQSNTTVDQKNPVVNPVVAQEAVYSVQYGSQPIYQSISSQSPVNVNTSNTVKSCIKPDNIQNLYNAPYTTIGSGCKTDIYAKNSFSDTLYDNLKIIQSETSCQNQNQKSTNNNDFATQLHKRNINELEYQCARNSYFTDLENELKEYDPNLNYQFKNTRFGTFLEDADDTKVGSILPRFVYAQYC
jgi:hypothetical protein